MGDTYGMMKPSELPRNRTAPYWAKAWGWVVIPAILVIPTYVVGSLLWWVFFAVGELIYETWDTEEDVLNRVRHDCSVKTTCARMEGIPVSELPTDYFN